MTALISYGTGYTANSAAATSLVIQPPPVYAAGNLLVMGVIAGGPSGGVAASVPAGWAQVSSGGATLALFTKTAGSSETAVTVTLASTSVAAGFIAAYPAATVASSSFASSGTNVASYTASFPGGVTGSQTVLLLGGSVANSLASGDPGAFWDNTSQNINLPAAWATDVPVFGPVNGSNTPADDSSALPCCLGLAEITGTTSNPVLTSTLGGTLYAGFLVLTVTGSPPSPYTVTATSQSPAATVGMALTVKALAGTATLTQIIAGAARAAFYAGGTSQAPAVTITPNATGSAVYGALTENQGVTGGSTFTARSGSTFTQNVGDSVSAAIYGTLQSSTATTASTPLTLGGTAPANAQTVGVLAEILAASGQVIAEAATATVSATQPGQYPGTTASQTAVFTSPPPAGSLLVAMVSANSVPASGNAFVTITDSGGLDWFLLASETTPAYAGVFIGGGPAAAALAAALTVNAAPAGYAPGAVTLAAGVSLSTGPVLGAGAVLPAGFALSSAPAAWLYTAPYPVTYLQYVEQRGTLSVQPGELVLSMGPASGWPYGLATPPADGRWVALGGGGNVFALEEPVMAVKAARAPAPLRSRAVRHGDRSRSAYGARGAALAGRRI